MKKIVLLALFTLAAGGLRATTASTDMDSYVAGLQQDYTKYASWFSSQFSGAAGAMAGSSYGEPPAALGLGHFEIGLIPGATMSPLDVDNLKNLQLTALNSGDLANNMPTVLPIPLGRLRAHLGLPGFFIFDGTDVGLCFGGLNTSAGDLSIDMSTLGLDFRGNLLKEGLTTPLNLALGLVIDQARGKLVMKKTDTSSSVSNGYTQTTTNTTSFTLDFQDVAVEVKAVASKKLLFIEPYAGLGVQVNSGSSQCTLSSTGTSEVVNNGNPSDKSTQSLTIEGKGDDPVKALDAKLMGGIQIDIFVLYLALGGEYGFISNGYGVHGALGLSF